MYLNNENNFCETCELVTGSIHVKSCFEQTLLIFLKNIILISKFKISLILPYLAN